MKIDAVDPQNALVFSFFSTSFPLLWCRLPVVLCTVMVEGPEQWWGV